MAEPPIWDRRPVYKTPSQARGDFAALSFRRIDADWKARQLWDRGGGAWLLVALAHVVAAVFHHAHAVQLGSDARWINEPQVILGVALSIIAIAMYRLSQLSKPVWLPVFCLCWIAIGFTHNLVTQVADKISMGLAFFAAVMAIGGVRGAIYMARQHRLDEAEEAA
ncbi:hypothetical protein GCM10009093_17810 [Brevundimonas terrae]|uniref:Uncharacterized protein n=1 Tax=Brevundimonas terrae TaxID=363631 RepID=A0ABN0YD65_9CAUL|nr:hypothetical protein [Brevundimonas terrae]NIJ26520.1 FtsH-binding integral membrane protein [Brevundimonas terrae]